MSFQIDGLPTNVVARSFDHPFRESVERDVVAKAD